MFGVTTWLLVNLSRQASRGYASKAVARRKLKKLESKSPLVDETLLPVVIMSDFMVIGMLDLH